MSKTIQTTIRLPEELYQKLKKQAREKGMTFNAVVLMALWRTK